MTIVRGKVRIDMIGYVEDMINEFPIEMKKMSRASMPAVENLFDEGYGKKLNDAQCEIFHKIMVKRLFVSKRARPDIHTTITTLCTQVKSPNESDWEKLVRLIKFLNGTRNKKLTLSADDLRIIKWFVDAAFAVPPDFKSHTGGNMTFGQGAVQ